MNVATKALLLLLVGCNSGNSLSPKVELDLDEVRIVAFHNDFTKHIGRVVVVIGDPQSGVDHRSAEGLLELKPDYITTNQTEILSLIGSLRQVKGAEAPMHGIGRTYHIFLFKDDSRVMQFRVFSRDLKTESNALVYPRSSTKFIYSTTNIVNWLRKVTE